MPTLLVLLEALAESPSQHNVTPQTSLVDPQGFPRADIDVWAIRHARAALARLRNDHRDVVERIGKVLEQVYARSDEDTQVTDGDVSVEEPSVEREVKPLAKVNMVSSGSPAESAVSF